MTADQFHVLTQLRLEQVWPGRSRKGKREVTTTADQLQTLVATLRGVGGGGAAGTAGAAEVFEATREGGESSAGPHP